MALTFKKMHEHFIEEFEHVVRAPCSFVDRKDFSWFQFHVFTFATVGIAPRSVDPEADQCRSDIWEGHVRRADRGHPPNEQTAFEASLDERYFFPFGRSGRIRGLISCV